MDFSDSVHLNKINTFFNVNSSAYDVDDPEASTNFICTLTVSDGQLSDTSFLHIILNNINDNSPTFDTPAYDFTTVADVSLNTVIGSVTATDGDVGELGKLVALFRHCLKAVHIHIYRCANHYQRNHDVMSLKGSS